MRPLVVLLLVLGSLAALLFALTTLNERERHGTGEKPITAAPVASPPKTPELVDPVVPRETAEVQPTSEATRQALQSTIDASGATFRYGSIEGQVVDEDGNPSSEAQVALMNVKPTGFGDDVYVLKGIEPPRPTAKVVTETDGAFRFDRLDPRKDWSLTVT